MTDLEEAATALREFKRAMQEGHPWLPGGVFTKNPGLDLYIVAALEGFVHSRQVAEQSLPAKRVSLTDKE